MPLTTQILAGLPDHPLQNLRQADRQWASLRHGNNPVPCVIQTQSDALPQLDWDVVICGATLGVFIGAALAQRGWRVALLERGVVKGRRQEWNISRHELTVLTELGLLTPVELETAIVTEYNPGRISFQGGADIWIHDVLNIGVAPVYLLDRLKHRFLAAGGQLFEQISFDQAIVHPNGINVKTTDGPTFSGRLLLDNMGHFSPIVAQARQGQKPDAICLVVGSCAQGYPANETGDLFASFTPVQDQCQHFWEAFPAQDGRTTYLFTYLDAEPERPSLEDLFEVYFSQLPQYQQVELEQLQFQRVLFGLLPSYRASPLQPQWDRVLQVGDSSGGQSPLSFGGFGALLRHLRRLDQGIHDVLEWDCVDRRALALLQPYQPSLSVTWLFQRSMSVGIHQQIDPNQINQLLATVFRVMERSGDPVLRPFMQDVIQFPALAQTMFKTGLQAPWILPKILPQVGLPTLITWLVHYLNLGTYSLLAPLAQTAAPLANPLPSRQQYFYRRRTEAWQYGSGQDYHNPVEH
jgi:lycopene cyclase CruP